MPAPRRLSSLHSNVEPASDAVNVNDGAVPFVGPVGPPVIVVSGAAVSTVNAASPGVASTLPAASVARTENVYAPSASGPTTRGDVQLTYVPVVAPGPSSLHSNVEPGFVEVNVNDGDATFVGPVGPDVIVVSGAAVSTVNDRVAGVASTLPAASVARTENVYAPSASGPTTRGDVQLAYVPVVAPGPSSLHSNVEPASVDGERERRRGDVRRPRRTAVIVVSGAACRP